MDNRVTISCLVLSLAVMITAPAIGQVLDYDGHPLCPTGHPGAIIDVQTGKLWLDVTETVGRSFNDITSKLGVGAEFADWRVATVTEIHQLLTDFGLPLTKWTTNPEAYEGVIEFVSIYGETQSSSPRDAYASVYSSTSWVSPHRMQTVTAAPPSRVWIGNNGFNPDYYSPAAGRNNVGTALVRDNVTIPRTVVGQDLTIFGANHYSYGDFGTSRDSMDPLASIDRALTSHFSNGGTETIGNNIETQHGWESTQSWEPYQLGNGSWKVGKGFDTDTILKGQYSRVGTKPGNFALFGVGFINDAEWRTRDLETYSSGSVAFQDLGTAPIEVKIRLDYDAHINGSALEKSAAVAINLIPTIVGAVSTAGGDILLEQALLEGLVKNQAQKWAGIQTQLVAEKSDFSGLVDMQLQLLQAGQVVDTIDVSSPEFAPDSVDSQYGGHVLKTSHHVNGQTTIPIDPTIPLSYRLDISTHAGAIGTAQAYMGVPYYKLEFSTPNQWSIPLIVERRDPAGNGSSSQSLLYGTIGTPELIDGDVQLVDAIGPYAAETEEKLVIFTNATPSGFTMPVSLVDDDENLQVIIASLVSGQENLEKIGVQIGYTTGDEFHSLFDDTLANLFAYEATSGLANMPYASQFVELDLDISGLPRGDQILLFAFGNLDVSGLESTLVMDSFSVVPEPATLSLLAMGGLTVIRRRKK